MRSWWIGPVFASAWLVSSMTATGALLVVFTLRVGELAGEPAALVEQVGVPAIAAMTALQFGIMLAAALALTPLLPGEGPRRSGFSEVFPLGAPRPTWLLAALLLAPTAGALPSWVAAQAAARAGRGQGVEELVGLLAYAAPGEAAAMLLVVSVLAPIVEELVFRGFLWTALERSMPRWAAWVVTSVIFALYHFDPLQVLAVLPIGFVLGWLRWRTGSLWASVVFHIANNTLASAVLVVAPGAEALGLVPSLVAAGLALGTLWGAERLSPTPRAR